MEADFATFYEYFLFASFVGPDDKSGNAQGTPADVKADYLVDGEWIELYEMPFRFDAPGNIIFGYLGAYIGFPSEFLVMSADLAQQFHTQSSDPPADTIAIWMGIELYRRFGENYTSENVREVLTQYHQQYIELTSQG